MKNKIVTIIILLVSPMIYCQGLSINQLLELRPKSISNLDLSLNALNYKLEKALQKDGIKQLNYESQNSKLDESITVHQYPGRDNFITYYYDSFKIQSNLITDVTNRSASLIKEKITEDGNIILQYKTNKYIYFFVKNEDISSVTIYTTKDFEKYYSN